VAPEADEGDDAEDHSNDTESAADSITPTMLSVAVRPGDVNPALLLAGEIAGEFGDGESRLPTDR